MDAPAEAPYNATVDLLERNLAPGSAERPYLRTESRTWSYAEVVAASDGAGAGLLGLGLQSGDRVLLATADRPEFVATFWGAIKAGLVPVPLAPDLSATELHFVVGDSDARALLSDPISSRAALEAADRGAIPCIQVGATPAEGGLSWSEVCGREERLTAADTRADDIALWLYTSGTTGHPKAAMHRHRHLRAAPHGLAEGVIGMEPDDVVLSNSRMFFAYGLGNSVYLPASAGASVVVNEAPSIPAFTRQLLERHRPTIWFGVPTFFAGFLGLEQAALPSSVRMILSAGERLPVDLLEGFRGRFGRPLLDGLGLTEALHHVTSSTPDDIVPGSAGRALEPYEIEARSREGEPVPDGDTGELWVRGPTTLAGYWGHPELTSRTYSGSWMRTGDLVRIEDGRVFHEGRLDDLIKSGGMWVAPTEIEDVLRGHPDVQDAAVVRAEGKLGVPSLKAFVLSNRDEESLSADLLRLCRQRLASHKIPGSFEVVGELPRTATGKLKRFVLRERPP